MNTFNSIIFISQRVQESKNKVPLEASASMKVTTVNNMEGLFSGFHMCVCRNIEYHFMEH